MDARTDDQGPGKGSGAGRRNRVTTSNWRVSHMKSRNSLARYTLMETLLFWVAPRSNDVDCASAAQSA